MAGLRDAVGILALSHYVRNLLLGSGLSEQRVRVVPPWVEVPETVPSLPSGTILFAGRISRGKGLDLLLRALQAVRSRFTLDVVGEGPQRAACESLAQELGLGTAVRFHGWVPRQSMANRITNASMLVFPSTLPETFGLVGPEAMAYGRPVVAFDTGAVREWLTDGTTGILVARGDVAGLGAAIDRLLSDHQLLRSLGQAARTHVIDRFSPEQGITRLVDCYKELTAA